MSGGPSWSRLDHHVQELTPQPTREEEQRGHPKVSDDRWSMVGIRFESRGVRYLAGRKTACGVLYSLHHDM